MYPHPRLSIVIDCGLLVSLVHGQVGPMPTTAASSEPILTVPSQYTKVRIAHATFAAVAWLIFFPMGSIGLRAVKHHRIVWIHATIQMSGFVIYLVASGMGIWMAKNIHQLNGYHPMIGMMLLILLILQPLTEILNHILYQKHPRAIYLAHIHLWLGRFLITAGIINGGLGFAFASNLPGASGSIAPRVAYGTVAVIVWVLYVSLALVWPECKDAYDRRKRRHNATHGRV